MFARETDIGRPRLTDETGDQAVLVTGAGTGIGLATAIYLSERGMRVYASVPDLGQSTGVEASASEHGVHLQVVHLDVTEQTSVDSAVERVVGEAGGIYGVVHSAGLGLRGFFEDLSETEIRRLFDVNVFGVMAVTRAVLPHMRAARRGRNIIISSSGGRISSMTLSGYCGGKFALEGFGEALALEVMPFGIGVSLIEPGLVLTPHFSVNRGRAAAALDPNSVYYDWFVQHEAMVDSILQKHHVTTEDVARAVYRALTMRRPSLRMVVGTRARVLIAGRRFLPEGLFDRLYRWQMRRAVIEPSRHAKGLSELSHAEDVIAIHTGNQLTERR